MKVHFIKQGTPEWHQIKLGKFSSTDAQAVASNGKGLETTCYKKASEIIIGQPKIDDYTNKHLERGIELEPRARTIYELETGNIVKEVGFVELDEFTGCSPDGLVKENGLIEIKCPTDYKFVKFLHTKKINTKYMWQMQFQLFVTDRKWVDYVIYNESLNKINISRVNRDEKAIEKIKEGLKSGKKLVREIMKGINENN